MRKKLRNTPSLPVAFDPFDRGVDGPRKACDISPARPKASASSPNQRDIITVGGFLISGTMAPTESQFRPILRRSVATLDQHGLRQSNEPSCCQRPKPRASPSDRAAMFPKRSAAARSPLEERDRATLLVRGALPDGQHRDRSEKKRRRWCVRRRPSPDRREPVKPKGCARERRRAPVTR